MEGWIVLMITGLCLDICGIVILAGPLLRVDLNEAGLFRSINISSRNSIQREIRRLSIEEATTKEIAEQIMKNMPEHLKRGNNFFSESQQLHTNNVAFSGKIIEMEEDKVRHAKNAVIALIIITSGFFLQIIANVMK